MARRWIGVALLFLGLAEAATVRAQYPPGYPGGGPGPMGGPPAGAPIPGMGGQQPGAPNPGMGGYPAIAPGTPLPVGISGIPGMDPSGAPGACPPGTKEPITLPNGPNAFGDEPPYCCTPQGFYFSVGGMGMARQRLTHSEVVVLDQGVVLPNGTTLFTDTGNLPARFAQQPFDMHDIRPNYNWGVRTTIGYQCSETCAFELSGYYLLQNDSFQVAAVPARLDVPFDIFPTPIGFQGDNGLWSQADIVRASLQTTLASAEGNFRYRTSGARSGSFGGIGIDLLFGVRFIDQQERFGIYTGDDDLTPATFDIFGNADPRVQAAYTVLTHNRIVGPQLGFDAQLQLHPCLTLGWTVKGAYGVNFLETDIRLIRGDGFVGIDTRHNQMVYSQVYETNVYLDLSVNDYIHIRGGYDLLGLVNIAEAAKQVDFNLANTLGQQRHNGSVLYQGPTLELAIQF